MCAFITPICDKPRATRNLKQWYLTASPLVVALDIRAIKQVNVCIIRVVVKSDFEICEYVVGFYNTNRTDTESIFNIVRACLTECKLDIKNCQGWS